MKKFVLLLGMLMSVFFVGASSLFLSGHLEEGGATVYETEDGVYVISVLSIADEKEKAVFRLNDEMSKGIKLKDSHVFKDGSEIVLRDLVINEAEDGKDEAYYYFYGTGEGVLELRNVSRYVVENNLCNFDTQCMNETKEDCCYDCGCGDEEICTNNECVLIEDEAEQKVDEEAKEESVQTEKVEKIADTKASGEKKVAMAILLLSVALVLFTVWRMHKRRRRIF